MIATTLESLKDLHVEQLRDLYNAEKQLIEALPKMVEKATHPELRRAFESHLQETRSQAERLESIFEEGTVQPRRPFPFAATLRAPSAW